MNRADLSRIAEKNLIDSNESNAHERAEIADGVSALAFWSQLQYPGPETGDWGLGTDFIPDFVCELRDGEVMFILAPVNGGSSSALW